MIPLRQQFLVYLFALVGGLAAGPLLTSRMQREDFVEPQRDFGLLATASRLDGAVVEYSSDDSAKELEIVSEKFNRFYLEKLLPKSWIILYPHMFPKNVRRRNKRYSSYLTLCHFKICNMGRKRTTGYYKRTSAGRTYAT